MSCADASRTLRLRTVVDVRLHITWDARGEHPATQLLGDCGHVLDTWPGDQVRTARALYLNPDHEPHRLRCSQCPR
jgi:hypothetical protein